MPTLRSRYGVALFLAVLVCSAGRCSTPGGPFVTVNITGIPMQATKLALSAQLGDAAPNSTETMPQGVTELPLTIEMRVGDRGPLLVKAQAVVSDNTCIEIVGNVTVELTDDTAYTATLALANMSSGKCTGTPVANLKLNKVENGGSGTVSSNLSGISCGAGCTTQTAPYMLNTKVLLTAQPAIGTEVKWSDPACDANLVCSVTLTQDTTITATFTACGKGSWCNEGSPAVATDLYGVWGVAGSSVYAVGEAGRILVRSTAGQWTPMTSGVTVALRTIAGEKGSKTPYAGGDSGTLLNLSGSTWNSVDLALVSGQQITGLAVEKNPYGKVTAYLCTATAGFFIKDGGNAWSAITNSALTNKVLRGVGAGSSYTGRESTVVGDAGFIFRRTDAGINPTSDQTANSKTTAPLRAVWTGGNLSVAVGDNGVIITRGTQDYFNTSSNWTAVTSGVTTRLNAVWGGDDNNVWIVGDGGVILKYDGTTVTAQTKVPKVDLMGVWAADSDPSHVYAVGRNGVILHYVP